MDTLARSVTGGVDTHLEVHVAAALDEIGTWLGVEYFEATRQGYKKLFGWLEGFGPVVLVGVEGTSSYGAGLTRHLLGEDLTVVEVDRPNRQRRRRKGKSDPEDAIAAARAALSGDACGAAKSQDGNVEAIRVIRVARLSARHARTQALNQMRSLISTAPEPIRDELRGLNVYNLVERAASYRPGTRRDVVSLTKWTLRTLARRAIDLEEEIKECDALLEPLVAKTAPALVSAVGIGTDTAAALLVAVGRQSAPSAQRGGLCPPLRHLADRCLERQAGAAPSQSQRGPSGQHGTVAHRHHPHGL